MAEDGAGFRQLTRVNVGGTPTVGLWATAAALFAMIISGSFQFVLLRKKEPETPRPYRAWGYPWTVGLVLFLSVIFLASALAADTRHSFYGLSVILASCPAFWLLKRRAAARK